MITNELHHDLSLLSEEVALPIQDVPSLCVKGEECRNIFVRPSPGGSPNSPIPVDSVKLRPMMYWVKEIGLTVSDQKTLKNGDWLTDKHVNALSKLLVTQFPSQTGLQDPLALATCQTYNSTSEDFVQIVNISNIHWICVSNVLCSPGVVEVYDSMPNFSFKSWVVKKQVAGILRTKKQSFEIRHVDVQRQIGGNDCAIFAMAFATSLCMRKDPHVIGYEQNGFRLHLARSYVNQKITSFPTTDRPRRVVGRQRIIHGENVAVYCTCRLPWNKRDPANGPLVQCQICKEWYHGVCMDIDKRLIESPALKFNCKICVNIDSQD